MASKSDRPAPDEAPRSRRQLLAGASIVAGSGAIAAASWPAARFVTAPGPAPLPTGETLVCPDSELSPGQVRLVRLGPRTAAVLRRHDGSLSAFDAACTHLGCTVRFRADKDDLHCGCHGAVFDASTGARRSGPAASPLTPLEVEVRDGRIYIRA